jgi:hypothetical protein
MWPGEQRFAGWVDERGFELRQLGGRGTSPRTIRGSYHPEEGGTRVEVTIEENPVVVTLLEVFTGLFGLGALGCLVAAPVFPAALCLAAFLVFGTLACGLNLLFGRLGSAKARETITRWVEEAEPRGRRPVLDAEPVDPPILEAEPADPPIMDALAVDPEDRIKRPGGARPS